MRWVMVTAFALTCVGLTPTSMDPEPVWRPAGPYREIRPPKHYKAIWDATKRCLTEQHVPLRGVRFRRVRWYAVDGKTFWAAGGWVQGLWVEPAKIYLSAERLDTEWLIAHEAAHAMIPTLDHPTEVFGEGRCVRLWAKSS